MREYFTVNQHVDACPTASEKPKRRKRTIPKSYDCGKHKADGQDFAPLRYWYEGSSIDAVELERRIVDAVERDQGDDLSRELQYRCPLGNMSFVHLPKFDREDGTVRRVMLPLFRTDPTLFDLWADEDANSIGAHRIINQVAIDDQAIGWLRPSPPR